MIPFQLDGAGTASLQALITKYKNALIVVAVFVIVSMFGANRIEKSKTAAVKAATSQLVVAQDSLHKALAEVQIGNEAVAIANAKADSADKRAVKAEASAALIGTRIPALVDTLKETHGDTLTDAEQALFTALDDRADSLQSALNDTKVEVTNLTLALNTAKTSLTRLTEAATHEDSAATAVVKVLRPSLGERIVALAPRPGIGAAMGVNTAGKPEIVFGVTISWPRK